MFFSFCFTSGLHFCYGLTRKKLSRTKTQQTHKWKINLLLNTSDLVVVEDLSPEPNYSTLQFCLSCKKCDKSPKTSHSVSAVLASLNLVLWILNLHPCDTGAGKGDEWLKLPQSTQFILSSIACGGNTISSDRHWLCVEFPLSSVGMVWMQSQPSVEDKLGRKLNTSICICNNQFV